MTVNSRQSTGQDDAAERLPCDVRLPPNTLIKAGCSLATLKLAMELEGRPKEFRTDQPPPNTGLTDVERVARALAKDAGEHWFACNRYRNENQRWLKAARAAIAAMQQPVHAIAHPLRWEAALREPCSMGVGCDEAGVCYAAAHGEPERCPRTALDGERSFEALLDQAAIECRERISDDDFRGGLIRSDVVMLAAKRAATPQPDNEVEP